MFRTSRDTARWLLRVPDEMLGVSIQRSCHIIGYSAALLALALASCSTGSSPTPRRPNLQATGGSGSGSAGAFNTAGTGGSLAIDVNLPNGGQPGRTGSGSCDDPDSSVGCEFYSARPPRQTVYHGGDFSGACFAAFIVNVSPVPVNIRVEHAGKSLDTPKFARVPRGSGRSIVYDPLPDGKLPPKEVAIVFLTDVADALVHCPIEAGVPTGPGHESSGRDAAFHIVTDAPVAAYDIFPYGGGHVAITSATLLLPTKTWDDNYIAVSAYPNTFSDKSTIQIVAGQDDTEVTIAPRAHILAGPGVPASTGPTPQKYTLNRGELLQLATGELEIGGGRYELTGSPVLANKPVALWGSSACVSIPATTSACDSAHQQIPPVRALGHNYVAVRHRNRFLGREEAARWRLVGAIDGTQLSYDPAPPDTLAPARLDSGQMAEFVAAGPFTVKSQDAEHPFYLAQYMTGASGVRIDANDSRGDPEFVNVVPVEQYMQSYIFFTDPTYPETSLVVIRQNDGSGFKDVSLDCAGRLSGWLPIGKAGLYEYVYVQLTSGNFEPQGNCDNGRHEITSDGPIALTVWAWGSAATGGEIDKPPYSQFVSYAYPAGAAVRSVNQVVVPPVVK